MFGNKFFNHLSTLVCVICDVISESQKNKKIITILRKFESSFP